MTEVPKSNQGVIFIPKDLDETSNLVRHAKQELELWGGPGYNDELDQEFHDRMLDIVRIFANMGHSGFSASIFTKILTELLSFNNLRPLTDREEEWMNVSDSMQHPTWQNRRNGEAFSEDGGKTYYLLSEDANINGLGGHSGHADHVLIRYIPR